MLLAGNTEQGDAAGRYFRAERSFGLTKTLAYELLPATRPIINNGITPLRTQAGFHYLYRQLETCGARECGAQNIMALKHLVERILQPLAIERTFDQSNHV